MSTIVLDDRNPAINYVGQWFQGGNKNREYEGTTTYCTPAPDTSAILAFVGTGVTVIGTIQSKDLQISSYSLDGQTSTNFTSTNVSTSRFSQPFFSIGSLSNDNHTLVVTPIKGRFLLDLITVQQPTTSATAASPVIITAVTNGSTSDPATSTHILNSAMEASMTTPHMGSTYAQNWTAVATSATQMTPSNQHHENMDGKNMPTNIWEVVAGISVGITVLCLFVLGAYFWIRRRNAKSKIAKPSKPRTSVTPYNFISHSGQADVDLRGSESLYAKSGIADCGDTMRENQNNSSPVISTSGYLVKATLNRDSVETGKDVPILYKTRVPVGGSKSPPPMYQIEVI